MKWCILILLFLEVAMGQEISIIRSGPYAAWASDEIVLEIKNTGESALVFSGYKVESKNHDGGSLSLTQQHLGDLETGGAVISVEVVVDNPGAEARLPSPPAATELGKSPFIGVHVLNPGESYRSSIGITATYAWREKHTVVAQFAPFECRIFQFVKMEYRKPAGETDDPTFPRGGISRHHYVYHYQDLPKTGRLDVKPNPVIYDRPAYFPSTFLVSEEDFVALNRYEKRTEFRCQVDSPAFDLVEAMTAHVRSAEEVRSFPKDAIHGVASYFRPSEVWWYVENARTHIIGRHIELTLEKDLSQQLIEANNKAPDSRLVSQVASDSNGREETRSPGYQKAMRYFQNLGYQLDQHIEKGGDLNLVVLYPVNQLIRFECDLIHLGALD
jgi:hypothetical protein